MQSTSPRSPRVDELLQLQHARVVEEQVAGHEHEVALLGERDELLHLGAAHRRRLLDEDVLAGLERLLRERVVRRHRRRDHDRVERRRSASRSSKSAGRPRARVAARELLPGAPRRRRRASELGEVVEVADEVRAPVAEAGLADADRLYSFQTFALAASWPPVALRKSTTTSARSTTSRVVDRRVRGHDRDAVVGLRLERRRASAPRTRARAGRGRRRRRRRSAAGGSASRRASRACRRCRPCRRRRAARIREPDSDFCSAVVQRLRDRPSGRSTACCC